jgi:hypothetical protein
MDSGSKKSDSARIRPVAASRQVSCSLVVLGEQRDLATQSPTMVAAVAAVYFTLGVEHIMFGLAHQVFSSALKCRNSLNHLKHRHASDRVCRHELRPMRQRQADAPGCGDDAERR